MLNYFLIYSVVWLIVIVLYLLGWSELNAPLEPELFLFFTVTIFISLCAGIALKDKFKFRKLVKCPKNNPSVTVIIIAFIFLEFAYCGQIPLVSVLRGSAAYGSFTGIRTFHPLLITFALFYAQYLFYLFLCFPRKKRFLFEYLLILFCAYFLEFNRGGLLMNLCLSGLVFLSAQGKRIRGRHVFAALVLSLILLFGFGVLGNMRQGYAWNDCWYIEYYGLFNDKYPAWLPKQFMWAYCYITAPVANLNYNISLGNTIEDVTALMASIFPDFVSKRIFREFAGYSPALIVHYLNTTTGYGQIYYTGGIVGMLAVFLYMMLGGLLLWYVFRPMERYATPFLGLMDTIVVFWFFTNTLSYSALSFALVYPILISLLKMNYNTGKPVQL